MSDPLHPNGIVPLEQADFSRPPPTNVFHQAPVFIIINNASQASNNLMLPPPNGYTVPQLQQNHTLRARPEVLNSVPQLQGRNEVWPNWLPPVTHPQIQDPSRLLWPQVFPATWNDRSQVLPQVQDPPRWAQPGSAIQSRVVDISEVTNEPQQPPPAICWKTNATPELRRSARNANARATQNVEEVPMRKTQVPMRKTETTAACSSSAQTDSSEEEVEDKDQKPKGKSSQLKRRKQNVQPDSSNESEQDELGRWMDGEDDLSDDIEPKKKKISKANQKKKVQKVERRMAEEASRGKKKRTAGLSDSDSDFEKEARKECRPKKNKKETEPKFYVPKRGKHAQNK